jgi:hypothetical protein
LQTAPSKDCAQRWPEANQPLTAPVPRRSAEMHTHNPPGSPSSPAASTPHHASSGLSPGDEQRVPRPRADMQLDTSSGPAFKAVTQNFYHSHLREAPGVQSAGSSRQAAALDIAQVLSGEQLALSQPRGAPPPGSSQSLHTSSISSHSNTGAVGTSSTHHISGFVVVEPDSTASSSSSSSSTCRGQQGGGYGPLAGW